MRKMTAGSKNLIKIIICLVTLFLLYSQICYGQNSRFLHTPPGKSKIDTQHPTISFSFGRVSINQQSIVLIIDDRDVTDKSVILPGFLTYKPEEGLLPGKHTVKVLFQDTKGKKYSYRWEFNVKERCLIKSVSHNATTLLMDSEMLIVEMEGSPDGQANFSIPNIVENFPMKEVSKGKYKGEYRVGEFNYAAEQYISVSLKMPDGSIETVKSDKPVSIFAQLFKVKIFSPVNEEKVSRKFVIKGRTKPDVKVILSITLSFKTLHNLIKASGPETGGIEALSDKNGYFEKEFGFPVAVDGLKAVISAYGRDKDGNKSMIDEVTVYLDQKMDRESKDK